MEEKSSKSPVIYKKLDDNCSIFILNNLYYIFIGIPKDLSHYSFYKKSALKIITFINKYPEIRDNIDWIDYCNDIYTTSVLYDYITILNLRSDKKYDSLLDILQICNLNEIISINQQYSISLHSTGVELGSTYCNLIISTNNDQKNPKITNKKKIIYINDYICIDKWPIKDFDLFTYNHANSIIFNLKVDNQSIIKQAINWTASIYKYISYEHKKLIICPLQLSIFNFEMIKYIIANLNIPILILSPIIHNYLHLIDISYQYFHKDLQKHLINEYYPYKYRSLMRNKLLFCYQYINNLMNNEYIKENKACIIVTDDLNLSEPSSLTLLKQLEHQHNHILIMKNSKDQQHFNASVKNIQIDSYELSNDLTLDEIKYLIQYLKHDQIYINDEIYQCLSSSISYLNSIQNDIITF